MTLPFPMEVPTIFSPKPVFLTKERAVGPPTPSGALHPRTTPPSSPQSFYLQLLQTVPQFQLPRS
ncbi:hypothetical protein SLEP1_g33790 [Rubroshorea leprosula]|uniref:Uncharacterized protein n=1 Tax=Rubroshorea leprosula TaxID=152421 RepID=A0AAV5KHX8_9ROSI|nr:hypothetical protein SLEP1_g33790 [Rubroshorea leprosula]